MRQNAQTRRFSEETRPVKGFVVSGVFLVQERRWFSCGEAAACVLRHLVLEKSRRRLPTGLTGYHSIPFSSSLWRRAIRPVLISAIIVLFFPRAPSIGIHCWCCCFFPSKPPDYSRHTHAADAVKEIYRSHTFPKPFISGSRLACHME